MQALLEKPHAFSFFQAVQLLQRYSGGAPVGGPGPATDEALRIRPAVSLSFPSADLIAIEVEKAVGQIRPRYRITTSFLGLYSSDSPLPTFYTEDLLWKETDQQAVRDFLDIFHHRALSLLYRAWEKYRYTTQFRHNGADEFSRRVFSLVGLGTPSLVDSTGFPAVRLLRYAGTVTQKPHSAAALSGVLRDSFALSSIGVVQCRERWVRIDPAQQNRLGTGNCTLGLDLTAGERVRDRSGKFRIEVGPVGLQDYLRFLPVEKDHAAMVNLVRFLTTDRLDFDIEVKLHPEEAPPLCLSSTSPLRLGWTTWLPRPRGDTSVVYRQPVTQLPHVTFPWPGTAAPGPAENRGSL
jgi:type VI secretion system protein ImpH